MNLATIALTLSMLGGTDPVPVPASVATLPTSLDFTRIRALVVQHDGRWPPLDTVARDTVESVTGDETLEGHDPVAVLLAWTFDPRAWEQAPVIRIKNAELRRELDLSPTDTTYSYAHLVNQPRLRSLIDSLSRLERGQKMDPLQSKVDDISGRLGLLQRVFQGTLIKPVPNPTDSGGAWQPIPMHAADAQHERSPVEDAWSRLRTAFRADDAGAFNEASDALGAALSDLPSAVHPDPDRVALELRYNRLDAFGIAWKIMLAAAVLSAVGLWFSSRFFDVAPLALLVAAFALLTYGLSMRWTLAQRIPASNMYESLLLLSWGAGLFAVVSLFVFRDRLVPLTAATMGAVALMLSDVLHMDHFIRPIAPVLLDTAWMGIHVPTIMVSYSVLAIAVLIAHVQLFTLAVRPGRTALIRKLDLLHYWYVHVGSILLTAGIITGSMWAASSWGRYWGWDPKEVWSLVALLGYLTILHVRIDRAVIPVWGYLVGGVLLAALLAVVTPKLAPLTPIKTGALLATAAAAVFFVLGHGMFATAVKSILAFWMIIMTYLGVNYVLGIGLHSYGFGTGAMASKMFLIGGIDLAIVGVLWIIHAFTSRFGPASRGDPSIAVGAV